MNRWYQIRRLRSAVLLILLGVLALLNQWNVLRWHVSWPLLLIAFGLLKLAERTAWTADFRDQQAAQGVGGDGAVQPSPFGSGGSSSWSAPPSAGIGVSPFVHPQSPAPENSDRPEDFDREDR